MKTILMRTIHTILYTILRPNLYYYYVGLHLIPHKNTQNKFTHSYTIAYSHPLNSITWHWILELSPPNKKKWYKCLFWKYITLRTQKLMKRKSL